MKTIFYSLAGEGLGHACRTQAIIENLPDYQVHLFTWGEAWEFFHRQGYPHLHKIVGLPFGRKANNAISLWKTAINFMRFRSKCRSSMRYIVEHAIIHKPCLFVCDFESVMPKAARYFDKPLLSIDNQHKFSRTIDKDIPLDLRFFAFLMGLYAEWLCHRPDLAIVSTFYHSAVKKKYCKRTLLTNCFMRKSVEEIKPSVGDYVLVYYKPSVGPSMLDALATTKEKVVVFNCPPEFRKHPLDYHLVGGDSFIKALAGCKAVFCAAGNQLLGEAVYYGKPIFTIPEPNQPEQRINAYYVQKMNYGMTTAIEHFMPQMVVDFLSHLDKYDNRSNLNGVHVAIEQIRQYSK